MSAVETGAFVVVSGGTPLELLILPEFVGTPRFPFCFAAEKFPCHPVGRVVVGVETYAEAIIILFLAGERTGRFHAVEILILNAFRTMSGGNLFRLGCRSAVGCFCIRAGIKEEAGADEQDKEYDE